MLFKVIITCVALGAIKAEPFRMEPQFEADDEDEVRDELLPKWLENTKHAQAEGTDVEIVEVEKPVEQTERATRRKRGASTVSGPMGADGVQLPTLEEYVAAGYLAERYDHFIDKRTKKPEPEAKVNESPVLIVGESKNEYGAIYMGHAADGAEVWDPSSPPPADASGIDTQPDGQAKAQR